MNNPSILKSRLFCPICGSERVRSRYRVDQYGIFRCRRCQVCFVSPQPRPSQLTELYSPTYFDTYFEVGYEVIAPTLMKEFERKVDLLDERLGYRGSLLEVGCGPGYFLRAAKQRGWVAEGVEVSAEVAAHAEEYSGVPVHAGGLESARLTRQPFDVVVMWATIEHLTDPTRVLIEAYRLLRPAGLLQLDTGLIDDLVGLLQPGYSAWFQPPDHLFFFTRKAIRAALGFAGFVDVEITTNLWLPTWRFWIHRSATIGRQLLKIARAPQEFFSGRSVRAKEGTVMYVSARRPG